MIGSAIQCIPKLVNSKWFLEEILRTRAKGTNGGVHVGVACNQDYIALVAALSQFIQPSKATFAGQADVQHHGAVVMVIKQNLGHFN